MITKQPILDNRLDLVSVLTDQSGAVVEKTTYEPYGEVKSGGMKSKFQYTGQEKDQETGLNYYDARYYNSHTHRFTQADTLLPDPYDPQQLNSYSYTRNNPLKYTDPTGHWAFLVNYVQPVLSFLSRVGPAVQSFATKATSNPTTQNVVQKTSGIVQKAASNPVIPKAANAGLKLHKTSNVSITGYSHLTFALRATQSGQNAQVQLYDANDASIGNAVSLANYGGQPVAGSYKVYFIPLSDLGGNNTQISGLGIQDSSGGSQPVMYVDSIGFINN